MTVETQIAVEFGARSDPGRARGNNEDSFCAAPELNLFVLSDGMGGQASGEVASRIAVETIVAHGRDAAMNPALPLSGPRDPGISDAGNRLASAIRLANSAVRQAAQESPTRAGMGATVSAVMLAEERAIIAHVGDSRVYRFRNGEIEQLTQDHSFIAEQVRHGLMTDNEAADSSLQNILMRAVGVEPEVQVEITEELFIEGDALLLCSDGLTKELPDSQIVPVLANVEDPQEAAKRLVDLANDAGGSDNITVIVLRSAPRLVGAFERIGRWFRGS